MSSPHDPSRSAEGLLAAYAHGYFPMAEPPAFGRRRRAARPPPLRWYNPDPRAVIPLGSEPGSRAADPAQRSVGGFHISRSLRRRIRSGVFALSTDTDFEGVVRACAEPRPGREETWIDERIIELYTAVHRAGHAHSIEARLAGPRGGGAAVSPLVGGIYGVSLGGAFFAESKFSRPELGGTDASKVCLTYLVAHLRRRGFTLLDVQFWNPHLEQFGVVEIPRREYLQRLREAIARPIEWGELEVTLPDLLGGGE